MVNFKDWLTVTPEQHKDVLTHEMPTILPERLANKPPQMVLQQQWAQFGSKVVQRLNDDTYQRLITYCLLAHVTPAVIANLVKDYVTTGKLPWKG